MGIEWRYCDNQTSQAEIKSVLIEIKGTSHFLMRLRYGRQGPEQGLTRYYLHKSYALATLRGLFLKTAESLGSVSEAFAEVEAKIEAM